MTDNAYLAENHRNVSILALRMSSRKRIGMYLNIESSNPLPSGLLPDYNGLAECIGFSYLEICNFARHEDPTNSLLNEWGNRPDLEPNLGKLVEHLLLMQRVDVLEDCKEIISKSLYTLGRIEELKIKIFSLWTACFLPTRARNIVFILQQYISNFYEILDI